MYIRILNFQTKENKKAEALDIVNSIIPKIKSLKGCRDCLFLMHESDNDYGLLAFWETKADADAAIGVIGPQLIPALNRISTEPVVPHLFEVYQPALVH